MVTGSLRSPNGFHRGPVGVDLAILFPKVPLEKHTANTAIKNHLPL